jgi:hypothetical protein
MERFRLGGLVVLSLVVFLANSQTGRSDDAKSTKVKPFLHEIPSFAMPEPATKNEFTCHIYPLGDLGDDRNIGKWIADTIPQVIQPGSWSQTGGKNVIRYYAPASILVVYHTPTTHAQVDAFLKNVKKSIQQKQTPTPNYLTKAPSFSPKKNEVMPAKYSPTDSVSESKPNKSTNYPVPAQAQQPKHLFHFIIRYEGEGIIDSTVAGVLKQLYGTEESEDEQPAKKKKKKSSKAQEQTSAPAMDQLFHLIVRYEGEGIIDSTVAEVLKAMYASGNVQNCLPPIAGPASSNNVLPSGVGVIRGYAPASSSNTNLPPPSPTTVPQGSPVAPAPLVAPKSSAPSY